MMKRVNRHKGQGDQVPPALRRMTFDRKTFVECSQRMKNLVPTLSRQKYSAEGHENGSREEPTKETNMTKLKLEKNLADRPFHSLPSTSPTTFVTMELNSDLDLDSSSDEDEDAIGVVTIIEKGAEDLVLPRTITRSDADITVEDPCPSTSVTIRSRRAGASTLPAKLQIPRERQSSRSMRRMLLKPFTRFAHLMSTIGGNLDITAYPTP